MTEINPDDYPIIGESSRHLCSPERWLALRRAFVDWFEATRSSDPADRKRIYDDVTRNERTRLRWMRPALGSGLDGLVRPDVAEGAAGFVAHVPDALVRASDEAVASYMRISHAAASRLLPPNARRLRLGGWCRRTASGARYSG